MLMCGKSSKFWNTMPMWARSFGRFVFGSPTEMPFTRISPFWKGSSPLTALMSVDLPDPDGPQTTTTSPFSTFVVQSLSTWNGPYHLLTCRRSIIGAGIRGCSWRSYRVTARRAWRRFTRQEAAKQMTKKTTATKR